MIVTWENLNFANNGIQYAGEYILGHNDEQSKNNLHPRAPYCIYFRPFYTLNFKHELYHIQIQRIITRRDCTSVNIPNSLVQ